MAHLGTMGVSKMFNINQHPVADPSHKKDGRQRRPHRFHVSPPPLAAESATGTTSECKKFKWLLLTVSVQVRIQDLVKEGPQLLRPKVADVTKWSRTSEASNLCPGSRTRLRAMETFGFLMFKYAFSHIPRDSFSQFFDIYFNTKSW